MFNWSYWIGLKTHKNSYEDRKNRPGHSWERTEGDYENLKRTADVLAHIEDLPSLPLLETQ